LQEADGGEQRASNLKLAVFGLGFVGSSITAAWLRAGATVDGYDVSRQRLESLENPKSIDFERAVGEAFEQGIKTGRLRLHLTSEASESDAVIKFICVPVYLDNKEKRADLSFLKTVSNSVGTALKKGDAVIVCPSVPPGTTRKVVVPILESSSGLSAGRDFDVIYSPERILVGRAVEDIEKRYPAVISGIDEGSLLRAETLFLKVAQKGVIKMPNLETAEFEKLAEGVYRDVNIALANELAMVCDELGVNFWSMREAANSQPYCHIHTPGLGVGGACIPVYPWFVAQSVKKTTAKIIEESREINDSMVDYLVTSLFTNFGANSRTKIAILGLSFRGGIADSRMSVTYRLVDTLLKKGITEVKIHDPLILKDARLGDLLTSDLEEVLKDSDIAIIVTDHKLYSEYPWDSVRQGGSKLLVIDSKGLLLGKQFANIELYGLGYGNDHNAKIYESRMN